MDIPAVTNSGVFKEATSGQVVPKPDASADLAANVAEAALDHIQKVAASKDAAYEAVKQAAEALKNTFAVSDVRFTIFKDIAGDYITRFTSLRDGSVKYYPQKSLYDLVKIRNAQFEAMVDAKV